jgi:3-oxoacyl-[acyl-carrier-protein] synthase-3
VDAACSGWLYGMQVAEGMIAAGNAETILVVGAELLSRIVNWKDRNTCVLFGDGAGAAIVQRSTRQRGILSCYMRSDGTLANLLYRPKGGAADPMTAEILAEGSHFVQMQGREVFKNAVRSMADACDRALDGAKLAANDIDLLIPHQANIRIIEATAKHANVPMGKVFVNVDRYGNTSAASVPIALDEAIATGRIKDGTIVMFVAFGAGFTWGSMVVRF